MRTAEVIQMKTKILLSMPESKVSKGGNAYVVLKENRTEHEFRVNSYSCNKTTINQLGKELTYFRNSHIILMVMKTGKVRIKLKEHFQSYTPKTLLSLQNQLGSYDFAPYEDKLKAILLLNRKSEWLRHKPLSFLKYFNLLKSFKSEKEFLKFAGVTFKLIVHDEGVLNNLILGFKYKNKQDLLEADAQIIEDTTEMINKLRVPKMFDSDKSISNLHNELIAVMNKEKASKFSNKSVLPNYADKILKKLVAQNLEFELLDSPRKLFNEGLIQSHCVGSKSAALKDSLFISVIQDSKRFTFQLCNRGILEAKGQFNKEPPKQLINTVTKAIRA